MRKRPPFPYLGGKARHASLLVPLLPPHRTYVEVFGGAAGLLFAKPPSPVEVYNDIDSDLVNFFRVLRDPEKSERLRHLLTLTPYSREEYDDARSMWDACDDDVERAHRWFVVARMSFSGHHGWSFSRTEYRRSMAATCATWLSTIEAWSEFHARVMRVQIEHDDFREILERYDTPETLFYLDPPYVTDTRRSGEYRHELTLQDHEDLVERLLSLQGMAMLSGYAHPIYQPLDDAGWQRYGFDVACHAAATTRGTGILGPGATWATGQRRIECVWLSPRALAANVQLKLPDHQAG